MLNQWLLTALLASGVAGLTIQPTNITQDDTDVDIALPSGNTISVYSTLEPLTGSADNLPTYGITDQLFHATAQNQQNLSTSDIAYISCDPGNYPGFTSLNDVFQTALGVNTTAIILYSLTAKQCNVTGLESAYSHLYSMPNQTMAGELLNLINNNTELVATVLHSDSSSLHNNSSSSSNGHQTQGTTYGSSPTTAVAMIILYSVTGIITALFLIIIVTGAVRAHRHPERYGPRNVVGRPRQTRARGIARAMLDTIPVVKFGEQQPKQDPKPTDVELAETEQPTIRPSTEIDGARETETHDQTAPRQSMTSVRSGIGAAATHPNAPSTPAGTGMPQGDEALGCSICTDDFEAGQDLRVLPCDHKFHPACIDPWLLNVSSTCPLCRIDLRPAGSTETETANTEGENNDLPPPINGYNGQPYRISMRRSLLIGLGLDRGHPDQEQRMAAARSLRASNPEASDGAQQEQGDEGRQRRRLRERFGIRTRRRGQSDAQAPTVAEETAVETPAVPEQERHGADAATSDSRPANPS